jgi:hypothetical protein
MANQGDPSTGVALLGLVLAAGGFFSFETILYFQFGWQIAALPVAAIIAVLGYRLCWVPTDGSAGPMGGNAGASGSDAGTGYVVRLDPEDPDAGIPRR